MKRFLLIGIFILIDLCCFSQIEPMQNYEIILKNEKLKSIKTMYYRSVDTTQSEGRVLFRKEFDEQGKLVEKYIYTFWDVVSYDHTTNYKYDLNDNLVEKTKIQRILNLGKRDADFIKLMGDEPINEKSFYTYNESNKLVKEVNFTFGKEGFNGNKPPKSTVEYFYNKKGELIKEIGKTPNGRLISGNYETIYKYDKRGNKINETIVYTTSALKYSRQTTYSYNDKDELIEEKTVNSNILQKNMHLKYEYDSIGRKTKVLSFSQEDNKWTDFKTYIYDDKGSMILGDNETTFEYYPNGLIKRELWESSKSDEVVNFITYYEFY